jgi:Flp pilus assembly pilin Flp
VASILDIGGAERIMNQLYRFTSKLASDERAQDLVEYSLLAGFVAVAAGAALPSVAGSISVIFSKMTSVVSNVALQ